MKGSVEVILADVDATMLGRVENVGDADPVEVVFALKGGPVAEDDAGEDFIAVYSFLKQKCLLLYARSLGLFLNKLDRF